MTETQQLLRAYVETDSEPAFREIVGRYTNLVYSTAFRLAENSSQSAEDITQSVFTDLARKASSLPENVQLGGWLHRYTCFAAANFMRSERRRQAREKLAVEMSSLESEAAWKQIAPTLDDTINQLGDDDRQAIVLRFFEQCDFRAVGNALGVSDDAAQKRVSRALDKLRELIVKQGATLSAAALGTLLASEAVKAAPMGLAAKVSGTALVSAQSATSFLSQISLAKATIALLLLTIIATGTVWWTTKTTSRKNETSDSHFSKTGKDESTSTKAEIGKNISTTPDAISSASSLSADNANNSSIVDSNVMRLAVITADTHQPVANVPIEYETYKDHSFSRSNLTTDRMGICHVPRPTNSELLQLTTQIEGFGETRLEWQLKRGDTMPLNYTLELERAIAVGGRVLDLQDQPIEGARVYFGCNKTKNIRSSPQSHDFDWVKAVTDAEGRWQMNRIAADTWSRVFCYAEHKNYMSEHSGQNLPVAVAQQLLAGTHVFHLKPAIVVRGEVVDTNERPISGATVVMASFSGSTQTGDDGKFSIGSCVPGKNEITASAEGFSSTTIEMEALSNSPPVRLVLKPGKAVHLKIVTKAGEPITSAAAFVRIMKRPDGGMDGRLSENLKADEKGEMTWNSAPDAELLFEIRAKTFGEKNFWLRPDGKLHEVALSPALKVHGAVRDENGASIPHFRIVCGWLQNGDGESQIHWGFNPMSLLDFRGGKYEHTFEDFDLSSFNESDVRSHVLKFEAEEHTSFISRAIADDEGDVQLDVSLKTAPDLMIEVFSPNGQPAAGADVAVSADGLSKIGIASAGLGGFSHGSRFHTDKEGHFKLPADDAIKAVIVAHADGFVIAPTPALASQPIIQLLSWGNIEGVLYSHGKPAAGRLLWATPQMPEIFLEQQATNDARGHFQFSKIPPGVYTITYSSRAEYPSTKSLFSKNVEVRPGETAEVNIGDSGADLTVRLILPPNLKPGPDLEITGTFNAPIPAAFQTTLAETFMAQPETTIQFGLSYGTKSKLKLSPEIQVALQNANHYTLEENPGGTFAAEGAESGTGLITFIVRQRSLPKRRIIAVGALSVTIPSDTTGQVIDVGAIELKSVVTE